MISILRSVLAPLLRKRKISHFVIFVVILCVGLPAAAEDGLNHFESLQKRLVRDGFDPDTIQALYNNKSVQFDTKGVSRFFIHQEGKLNYDQFTEAAPIQRAKEYISTHKAAFDRVKTDTGVEHEVITAILLVETRLGKYFGSGSIFNTLSTMAALKDPDVLEAFWQEVPPKRKLSRSKFEKKARDKSGWAYTELKALLKYAKREKMAPLEIIGSYAGAMGIAQFMPSNALTLAVDGNQDGRVDLFDNADAIASVANYLNHHGWKPELDREGRYKVILHYNRSSYYANTVLKIAELLKKSQ
jgi:membrane-bound lytic murein transglycosylase B